MPTPKLVVHVHDGLTAFTTVTLNGQDVQCTRLSFDTGEQGWTHDGLVRVQMEFVADIEVEMTGETPGLKVQHLRPFGLRT